MAMGSPSLAAGDTPASIHAAHPRPPQAHSLHEDAGPPRRRCCSPHRLLPRSPLRAPRQRRTTSAKTEDLYRGDAASELRRACRWRRYWQVWGEALGLPAMAFLAASASRSLPGGGAGLASPRPKLDGVSSPDRGGRYFIYRPPWVAGSRWIVNRWSRLSKGDPAQTGR